MVLDFGNQKNLVVVGCDSDSWGDTLGRRRKGLSIIFEDAASKSGVHMENGCQIVFLSFVMIKRIKLNYLTMIMLVDICQALKDMISINRSL